jgi:hypothetical protein
MSCCNTNINLFDYPEFIPPIYTDDDIYTSFNPLISLNIDITTFVECALATINGSIILTNWIQQLDLNNGNNFSQKIIKPLIENSDFSTLPLGRYVLMLRITTNGITQTYRTNKIITLV